MIAEPSPNARAFPQRRHFVAAALFFVAIAIYGSFVPWNYTPISVRDAALRFKDLPLLQIGIESRADWVANILLFIPIAFCAMAAAVVDRRPNLLRNLLAGVTIWLACVALSFAIEFAQFWFPPRTTSQNDIQAECLGAAIGIVLARYLANPIALWLRRATGNRQPHSRLVWLLQLYVAGLVVYQLLPLDITIHPRELWEKHKAGRIELVPFTFWRLDRDTLFGIANDMLMHLPLGACCALGPLPGARRRGSLPFAVLASAVVVAACEFAQVFVYSRYADTTDVFVATIGAAIGACVALRFAQRDAVVPSRQPAERRNVFWIALAGFVAIYVSFLCAVYWSPFEVLTDPRRIERRLHNYLKVPFSALYWGTEFNAVTQVLGKFFSFFPLGIAAALAARRVGLASRPARITAALLVATASVALGAAIELVQTFFPPHFPDITDTLFYATGTIAGYSVARYVLVRSPPSITDSGQPTPPDTAPKKREKC